MKDQHYNKNFDLSLRNNSRSRSKSPTRKASKTNQQNQSNEIAALKAEIEELKQKQNSKSTEAKTHEESNSTSNFKTMQHAKNVQEASAGGQLEKVELLSVTTIIKETMKTLATYGKQLKSQLDISLIQTEI